MSAPQKPMRLFLAGTEFFGTGGVQQINRLLLRAWLDFAAENAAEVEAFSYADGPEMPPLDWLKLEPRALRWHGMARNPATLARRIAARICVAQPHVVLLTHVSLLPLLPLVLVLCPRARVALLAHGVEVWERLPLAQRCALRCAHAIVAPSRYTAMQLAARNGVRPGRITVLAHGIEPAWDAIAEDASGPTNEGKTLLTVARLSTADAAKGVDRVIGAMPAILAAFPETRLIIAGGGDNRLRLESLAARLRVGSRVTFRGEAAEAELRALYSSADVFVLPSRKEGFGLVFAEAMACGKPVVAARAAAAPEVVEHGVTGLLVSGNGDELAQAILSLLRDPDAAARMGRAGCARARERFLYRHFAERWTAWLAQLHPRAQELRFAPPRPRQPLPMSRTRCETSGES